MAYGFSIAAPMDSGYVPPSSFLPGRPELPNAGMPVIEAVSSETLGRRNTLAKALPAMPASEIGDLSFTNYRAVDAAEQMQALAVGQAERKQAERYNTAVARSKDEQMQKYAEKSANNYSASGAYKRSKYSDAKERAYARQSAGMMGAMHLLYPIR